MSKVHGRTMNAVSRDVTMGRVSLEGFEAVLTRKATLDQARTDFPAYVEGMVVTVYGYAREGEMVVKNVIDQGVGSHVRLEVGNYGLVIDHYQVKEIVSRPEEEGEDDLEAPNPLRPGREVYYSDGRYGDKRFIISEIRDRLPQDPGGSSARFARLEGYGPHWIGTNLLAIAGPPFMTERGAAVDAGEDLDIRDVPDAGPEDIRDLPLDGSAYEEGDQFMIEPEGIKRVTETALDGTVHEAGCWYPKTLRARDEYDRQHPDRCGACHGWGGFPYYESDTGAQGVDLCEECADRGVCPRCGQTGTGIDPEDEDATCSQCGFVLGETQGRPEVEEPCFCLDRDPWGPNWEEVAPY